MYIKEDYGFWDLYNRVWEGAKDTLEKIRKADMIEEFMDYMNAMYDYSDYDAPTITEINDWLRFDDEIIFDDLEIGKENDED